jgi:hypothetical protein
MSEPRTLDILGNCGLPFPARWEDYSAAVQIRTRDENLFQALGRAWVAQQYSRFFWERAFARLFGLDEPEPPFARVHLEKSAERAWELLGLPPRERRVRRSTVTQADVAARARRRHRRGDP